VSGVESALLMLGFQPRAEQGIAESRNEEGGFLRALHFSAYGRVGVPVSERPVDAALIFSFWCRTGFRSGQVRSGQIRSGLVGRQREGIGLSLETSKTRLYHDARFSLESKVRRFAEPLFELARNKRRTLSRCKH